MEANNQSPGAANEPKASSQPPTGRFMDVQPPATTAAQATNPGSVEPQVAISPDGQLTPSAETAPSPEPAQEVVPAPPTDQTPVEQQSSTDQLPPADTQTPLDRPQQSADTIQPATTEHPPLPKKSSNLPLAAVLVAITITLGLSGLVIMMYFKSKNDTIGGSGNATTAAPTNSQPTVAKPQASPADIDQVTAEIDESLSAIDEAADFSADAISDKTLGL